jgi:hypothetical protein
MGYAQIALNYNYNAKICVTQKCSSKRPFVGGGRTISVVSFRIHPFGWPEHVPNSLN